MPLRRFQPISRAAQWSEPVRWIDQRNRKPQSLADAILTMGLYQRRSGYGACCDYGVAVPGWGRPVLAAATQADGSGPFVILADGLTARFTFPAEALSRLWPGDALLIIWATVDGQTDEIQRETLQVSEGPRALPIPVAVPIRRPSLLSLGLSSATAIATVGFQAAIIGKSDGTVVTATASDGSILVVAGPYLNGTFAAQGMSSVTLTETRLDGSEQVKSIVPITVLPAPSSGGGQPVLENQITVIAAQSVGGHRVVRSTSGGVRHASSAIVADADTAIGVTTQAAAATASVIVQVSGAIDEPSWAWTPGPVFLGADGALTQMPPVSGFVQRVGVAVTATRIIVDIDPAILRAN